jgi:hypothetical protein
VCLPEALEGHRDLEHRRRDDRAVGGEARLAGTVDLGDVQGAVERGAVEQGQLPALS